LQRLPSVLLAMVPALLLATVGCAQKVDRFTIDRVVARGLAVPDVPKVCALGESLAHPLAATSSAKHPPREALVIAELTSATCEEEDAWSAELDGLRAKHNLLVLGDARANEITDARIREQRAHTAAATRFYRAFGQLEAKFGPVGEACPKIAKKDEIVYVVGLVAGTLGLLHDRAGGGEVGVPIDTLGKVARGGQCLDDERWWHVPSALQAAAWEIIPGSQPTGVDPWERAKAAADAGDTSGVRIARALQVLVAANAGRTDVVDSGLRAHAASIAGTPQSADFALLDEYARLVDLHQSDVLWTEATGHRTPVFGTLPGDDKPAAPPPDPFE
jgi:hypothetical protein